MCFGKKEKCIPDTCSSKLIEGDKSMKKELLITAKNKISTHSRIYNMFNKKGYNLESVVSNTCEDSPEYIKMTLAVVKSDLDLLEQIKLNLYKIVDIIDVKIV